MTLEDIADGLIAEGISKIGEGADNAVIAPRAIVLGHADHQGVEVLVDLRTTWRLALPRAIKLLCHKFTVPAENRIGLDDVGHCLQGLLAQLLPNHGEGLPFAVAQPDAPFDLVAEDTILRD